MLDPHRNRIILFTGIAAAFFLITTFISCEKEVHINLSSTPPQMVVQGQIKTGEPPFVVLTNTIGFFSSIDLNTLENSFIHDAIVSVSNGTQTVNLKEYSVDTGSSSKFYFYTVDTASLGNIFFGEVGKFYTLTIQYNGKTYTSITKIPNPQPVDTMWFDKPVFADKKLQEDAKELYVNYTDPDTPGNYVRYFTKRNSELFYPGPNVYSDEVINGTTVTQIDLEAGFNKQVDQNTDSLKYFYPGDTVTLEWDMVDKGVYNFWNTYQFAQQSTGNPFSSPINVQSNVSNGALGVWAGYGTTFKTLIVQ